MFIVIYILLFALFIFLLDRKIKHGPEDEDEERTPEAFLYRDPLGKIQRRKPMSELTLAFIMVLGHWRKRHLLRMPGWI